SNPSLSKPNLPGVLSYGSNQALSPLYNTSGLVGYWNFDEGTGTIAKDTSGNGNNGTWAGIPAPQWISCKIGTCPYFNGNWITIPDNDLLDLTTTDFSFSFWINQSSSDIDFSYALSKSAGGGNLGWGSALSASHYIWSEVYPVGGQRQYAPSFFLPLDSWHFITVTVSRSGYMTVYLDSVYKSRIDISAQNGLSLATIYPLTMGYSGISGLIGSIDDVRVYNRALSVSEIQALYNATK
ncbi:MAG: LamG domain-containing protein, partial [Candidatus Paceibacterota bacterium]